jgi:PST family polysaccharide transporter
MAAGATRATFVVNSVWAVALIPALVVGTMLDGIEGTAIAHVVVGFGVALPITAMALHRVGVALVPIVRGLVRPVLGAVAAASVAVVVGRVTGDNSFVQLLAGGSAGFATYAVVAFRPTELRAGVDRLRRRSRGRHALDKRPDPVATG